MVLGARFERFRCSAPIRTTVTCTRDSVCHSVWSGYFTSGSLAQTHRAHVGMSFPVALLRGLLGLTVFLGIAVLFSTNRRAINWRLVAAGVGLQVVFAVLVLKTGPGAVVFNVLATFFETQPDVDKAGRVAAHLGAGAYLGIFA